MLGTITNKNHSYVHAQTDDGLVYVHCEECDFLLAEAQPGDVLEIDDVYETPKGLRATRAHFVERQVLGERIEGTVVTVNPRKGFAFLRPDDGATNVFLHTRTFVDYVAGASTTFASLVPGDRLSCERVSGRPNPRGERVREGLHRS